MVFHDYTLDRLTARSGRVDAYSVEELQTIKLNGSSVAIPTLADVLAFIPGRTPLLIEIKDQSEGFTQTDCALERRVCEILSQAALVHTCAIMSFNPFVAKHVREALPEIARGVVSYDFEHEHDAAIPADHRADLASLKWVEETEVDFVSYGAGSLPTTRTDALRAAGMPIFCWTIRSAEQAATALQHCDQITFEGYRP
jgi:glycerophosphoryl diester phosphodiesterase